MKYFSVLLILLITILLSSCDKEDVEDQWTLVSYANIAGEIHCTYQPGDIIWNFHNDILEVDGRLVTPWAFVPCYEIDEFDYQKEFAYTIDDSEEVKILNIDGLGLEAKITIDDELVIEIISSTEDFRPITSGVKVYFEKF